MPLSSSFHQLAAAVVKSHRRTSRATHNAIAIAFITPTPPTTLPIEFGGSNFIVALPVSFISLLLFVSYRPAHAPNGRRNIEIRLIRPIRERFTLK
ncbi:hypothetical protein C8F04DRAFT_1265252 [Mycena alexandri]|uniref:Uncharacterized protein n=1 Tax=Mycena alexandri TaxID=1745969 RepID=A0AAD6SKB7_9AGAR|nr:hypothetical protein C8F04DRAFT_1265252 [Mycena alexandri]